MLTIPVKKLKENAILPTRGSEQAAGYDLHACIEQTITILPGQTISIPTGLSLELPEGYVGLIYARSGLATKFGLAPANKVGVCDSDYRGEYIVPIYNHSNQERQLHPGDRIAQLIITPFLSASFEETDALSTTHRGDGGFGSTGK